MKKVWFVRPKVASLPCSARWSCFPFPIKIQSHYGLSMEVWSLGLLVPLNEVSSVFLKVSMSFAPVSPWKVGVVSLP